ncbi:hypothetical protein [Candidatus Clostridium stratigraminis]|uniref:Lipoprotein n=1 Tax=Candidatus Clostridium stratigraminis TaxID=3381661 RepID=A0ABW8T1E4_9CLOT
MKNLIIFIVFAVLLIFVCFRYNGYNPYSGTYEFTGNSNLELKLNNDNSFILYYVVGKDSELIKGKYQVKDNSITLTPNKNNLDKFITETLHGNVEGKKIIVSELHGDFIEY